MATVAHVLERELAAYEANKDKLLAESIYKFVLIKEDRVLGTFESQQDAINCGYRELGLVPFLVKQIVPEDMPIYFSTPNLFA